MDSRSLTNPDDQDQSIFALLPDEIFLYILSLLQITDFNGFPTISMRLWNIFTDWQLMKSRFARHFPTQFEDLKDSGDVDWLQEFANASQIVYQGNLLSPSQKKKFFHLRERNIAVFKANDGDFTFFAEDLYPSVLDGYCYSLVDYAYQTSQQDFLNYWYAQIKSHFVTNLSSDVSMRDNVGGLTLGWTLLCWAVYLNQDQQELQRLLDAGQYLNGHPDHRQTPLGIAAMCGRAATVKFLLGIDGVDVDCGRASNSPLMLAAEDGHAEVCKILLAKQARVDARDVSQLTPLHKAARNGHVDIVAELFHAGADINFQAANPVTGPSALHLAIIHSDEPTVRFLIMHGADLLAEVGGKLATHLALDAKNLSLLKLLVEEGAPLVSNNPLTVSLLVASAIAGNQEFFNFALSCEQVTARPDLFSHALFHAAKHGNVYMVEKLIGLKVNPHVKFQHLDATVTAGEIAVETGHDSIAQELARYTHQYDHPDIYDALNEREEPEDGIALPSTLGLFASSRPQDQQGARSGCQFLPKPFNN